MAESDLMHRDEAATYLRLPVATLSAWAYRGIGPSYMKVGRRAMYRRTDLDWWLEGQRVTR